MKVLLTGVSGQVGQALLTSVPAHVDLRSFTRAQLDISDSDAVHSAVDAFRPQVIINAAAYTAVDKAEAESDLAHAVNADGPRHLAEAASAISACRLLHISTDYVFDGRKSAPYKPGDPTNPLGVYGLSKLAGERATQEVLAERAVVLRTAWVYAPRGKNFVLTMLRLMRERGAVRVVADQEGTPTAASSIAKMLWTLSAQKDAHGILHWTDAGKTTWYDFAVAIAEEARSAGLLSSSISVTPITTAEFPTPARRPPSSVLDTSESTMQTGLSPTPWRVNLRATLSAVAPA